MIQMQPFKKKRDLKFERDVKPGSVVYISTYAHGEHLCFYFAPTGLNTFNRQLVALDNQELTWSTYTTEIPEHGYFPVFKILRVVSTPGKPVKIPSDTGKQYDEN